MEDIVQSGASNSSTDSRSKEFMFSDDPINLSGQLKTPQIQIETDKKLLRSNKYNLDR